MFTIIKRDGKEQEFDTKRIFNAIYKAAQSTDGVADNEAHSIATLVTDKVTQKVKDGDSVDAIQDMVEKTLMASKYKGVASKYIEYRHDRDKARKAKTHEMFLSIVNAEANEVTTRKCKHVRRDSRRNDDEVCIRNHSTFCR